MLFFFFKQKTAYEMRISDWSSDVCSSDLFFRTLNMHASGEIEDNLVEEAISHFCRVNGVSGEDFDRHLEASFAEWRRLSELDWVVDYEIGRASCRERVCQYV